MAEATRDVASADQQFVRRTAALVIGWTTMFLLASAGLVIYGDVLMDLFA